jgi:hypothetical protein
MYSRRSSPNPNEEEDNNSDDSLLEFQSCASEERHEPDPHLLAPPPASPPPHDSDTNDDTNTSSSMLLEQVLFFGCGLGSSLGYIATLSSLVYFKILYGPNSFVDLNVAVYVPLLPISLAQARWDQYMDQQFRSRRTFLVRGMVGFALVLWGTIQMALHTSNTTSNLVSLIGNALLQGIGGAILYGQLNQMVSFHDNDDGRLKATVSAGVQSSALVVLVVSIATGFGTHNAERFSLFLFVIVAIEWLCFAMFLWLLTKLPSVAASMIRRDSSIRLLCDDDDDDPLLDSDNNDTEVPLIRRSSSDMELSFKELWTHSRSCCLVLIVTLVPSFLVGSWFTRVQTDWMALAQVFFYVRIGADLLWRLATIIMPPRSIACVTWTAVLRVVPVILFFQHANVTTTTSSSRTSDAISIVLVAVISFFSGYLVTACFQLAPQGLQLGQASESLDRLLFDRGHWGSHLHLCIDCAWSVK